jgi:hypothetical protein
MSSKSEQETILRWDEEEKVLWVYTACERVRRRYAKLGWQFTVTSVGPGGPHGWTAKGPCTALKLRRLEAGAIKRRPARLTSFKPRPLPASQTVQGLAGRGP